MSEENRYEMHLTREEYQELGNADLSPSLAFAMKLCNYADRDICTIWPDAAAVAEITSVLGHTPLHSRYMCGEGNSND